jgi:predicted permease
MLAAADTHKKAFNKGYLRAEVIPLLEDYVGTARSWMLMLLGAVGLVLLIACANVANLVLAHSSTRVRELTLRGAIGASRWRIARQLIAESLLLSVLGAAAGVLVAWWGLSLLRGAMPTTIPRAFSIGLDLRVLGFTSLLAIGTGFVCGLLPALRGSRVDLVGGLKDGTGATAGAGRQRVRHMLAWAEIALAVMLLVGAGLFISSFARLMRVDQGFDPSGLTSFGLSLPRPVGEQKPDPDLVPRVLAAVRAVPGVDAALIGNGGGPYEGGWSSFPLRLAGRPVNADESIRYRTVSTGFMTMLNVPIRAGRDLSSTDTVRSAPVALVNEAAARAFWGTQTPLGSRLEINTVTYEVVGVVGDMRYQGPAAPPVPEAFLHYEQVRPSGGPTFLVRSRRQAGSVLPDVKAAIWTVVPGGPITTVRTAEELFGRATATRRFNMLLMSIFAALALVIAATGIYGVIAFVVSQRTREIGVRVALGARGSEVVRMFLRQGATVIAAGITAGLIGAWLLARTVQGFLFEVEPRDPVVFTVVAVVLAFVGLLACWLPARRAARIDPLIALRSE